LKMCYFVLRTSPGWISDNATNTNVELLKGNVGYLQQSKTE